MKDPRLTCTCRLDVVLKAVGGQEPDTYRGQCDCGAMWDVTEYTVEYYETHCVNCQSNKNTILKSGRCQDCEDNLN